MAELNFIVLLLFFIFFPISVISQKNITLGSTLTPQGTTSSWLSPSGDFAFGFRSLDSNQDLFLLSIFFAKTPNKTVVWYANGDSPVTARARLDFTKDGSLSLRDEKGVEKWTAGINGAAYASMLDSGNFVLVGFDGATRWQSFNLPTDTLLPGQVLQLDSSLRSKLTDEDYSDGRFTLRMQLNGNLVAYSVAVPTGSLYDSYYSSETEGIGLQLVFDKSSGEIYVALPNGKKSVLLNGSATDGYQRATLDPDGVFRRYFYAKSSWESVDGVPEDICQAVISNIGSGACGYNAYCKSGNVKERADCKCPPQYSFIDPINKYKGCKPDFSRQACDSNGTGYDFVEMVNVDWPLADYELYRPVTAAQCKQICLSDCFCDVAILREENGYCWKKKLPLTNGKMGSYVDRLALIKVKKISTYFKYPKLNFVN